MRTKRSIAIQSIALLMLGVAACGRKPVFIAPEIPPMEDLIPAYIPDGFELVSGFEIAGDSPLLDTSADDRLFVDNHRVKINLRSPMGEDVVGVHYEGQDQLILITRSPFPEGTLDLWISAFEGPFIEPCTCDCVHLRERVSLLRSDAGYRSRLPEVQETRIVKGTPVAILERPEGWITVFMRGDDLLTVESGIDLAENLKIVASLLDG
ncbi:MAG TPA: hypothetical protein G4O08_03685 [Anaerolineae bacterium]|nr:hypothetical protein [Anaerolineae bacterium]